MNANDLHQLIEKHAKAEWFDGNEDAPKILSEFGIALLDLIVNEGERRSAKKECVRAPDRCVENMLYEALEELRK